MDELLNPIPAGGRGGKLPPLPYGFFHCLRTIRVRGAEIV